MVGGGLGAAAAAIVRGARPCASGPQDRGRFRGALEAGCGSVGETVRAGRCRCHCRCPAAATRDCAPRLQLGEYAWRARPAPPAAGALCGARANQRGGGRGGEQEAGRCVCGAPAVPADQAWERARRGSREAAGPPGAAPALPSLERLAGLFLAGPARFPRFGLPPLGNPEREEPLTPLAWPLPCTPLRSPFSTPAATSTSLEDAMPFRVGSLGGKLGSALGPLCCPAQPLGGGKERHLAGGQHRTVNFHVRPLTTLLPPAPGLLTALESREVKVQQDRL